MLVLVRVDPLDSLGPNIVVGEDITDDTGSIVGVAGVINSTSLYLAQSQPDPGYCLRDNIDSP